jgi:hypothetical protein
MWRASAAGRAKNSSLTVDSLFKLIDFVDEEWSEQGKGMDGVLVPCHLTLQKGARTLGQAL